MKKIFNLLAFILVICIAFSSGVWAGEGDIVQAVVSKTMKMTFNDQVFEPKESDGSALRPLIVNGRSYLPLRALCDLLGVWVQYDEQTQTIDMHVVQEALPQTGSGITRPAGYVASMELPITDDPVNGGETATGFGFVARRGIDFLKYSTFTPDEKALGVWTGIDILPNREAFDPLVKYGTIWVSQVEFTNEPIMKWNGFNVRWTKGLVFQFGEPGTVSAYTIETINGKDYMFLEHKNGDYTMKGWDPWIFVYTRAN